MKAPRRTLSEMQQMTITSDNLKHSEVNPLELLRLEMLTSFEKYTRAMFKAQYKKSFIVAEHHKKIIQALQDVVDGKMKRLIINIAPRYGKCVSRDSLIYTTEGLKRADSIVPGDEVFSFHQGHAAVNTVLATEPAFKPSVEIKMRSGRSIICSDDHPMLSVFGYKQAKDFKPGDYIQALAAEIDGELEIPDEELIFCSVMMFEGHCKESFTFANDDKLVVDVMTKACSALDIPIKQYKGCEKFEYYLNNNAKCREILSKYKLYGHLAYTKRIPKEWFAMPLRQKYMFIDMMIATDGAVDKRSGQIQIGLANEGLIKDIQCMLSTMGVASTYVYRANEHAGVWVLAISRQFAQKLYPHLTFYRKAEAAKSIMEKQAICHLDSYPYDVIRHEKLTYKTMYGPIRCASCKNITRDKFRRLVDLYPQLSKYLCEDFYLDEVLSVTPVGNKELIHLEVENDHNFIADGLVSHNTELVIKSFISWCFALNPKSRFLHLSYSDVLVNDNSDTVRNIMQEELYTTLFPESVLESAKASAKRWKTKAGGEMYAVSTQGQVTGFGAGNVDEVLDTTAYDNLTFDDSLNGVMREIGAKENVFQGAIMIDDPIKPEDADSDLIRERINLRFENTIRNRTNSRNTPIIIIMQRLHEHDLCGYLQEIEPDEWTVLSIPVVQKDENTGEERALWPMKHTLEELRRMREINPLVFDTQYMQDPTPKEGLMYAEGFRTYTREQLPMGQQAMQKWNYTDTADTGADFLCSICFINTPSFVYVTDVIYTDEPMEVTEMSVPRMLDLNQTSKSLVESNNGGRSYARTIKNNLRKALHNFHCTVNWFTQTQNKASRIYSNSAQVMNDVLFPEGWERKWPKFYAALMSYRKDNKKKQHDDAPDCLTGCYELHANKNRNKKIHRRN